MNEAQKVTFFTKAVVFVLVLTMTLLQPLLFVCKIVQADSEPRYCDSIAYYDSYNESDGAHTEDDYTVYHDDVVVTTKTLKSVPSMGVSVNGLSNTCAPVTGSSIVCYYDQWCTNLVPNYEPGATHPKLGIYVYYADVGASATAALLTDLYNRMGAANGGTTSSGFFNGLNGYVQNAGYTLSYTSMYTSSKTVNLSKVATAVDEEKVGLLMCGAYNYVGSITTSSDKTYTYVVKMNSTVGHMMMVYGYKIYEYYKDGVIFRTDTFLRVCSGFSSGEKGYILLNDDLTINEAYIITIS